jgi:hypothetical protein
MMRGLDSRRQRMTVAYRCFRLLSAAVWLSLLPSCRSTDQHAAPVSWVEQLNAARRVAAVVDPDATLINVGAAPAHHLSPGDHSSLRVRFQFVRQSGDTIHVTLEDTRLLTTLKKEPGEGQIAPPPTTYELQRRHEAIMSVQLSAADALRYALTDRQAVLHEGRNGQTSAPEEDINIALKTSEDAQRNYQTSAVWLVLFTTLHDADVEQLVIAIDAGTGKVLSRETRTLD